MEKERREAKITLGSIYKYKILPMQVGQEIRDKSGMQRKKTKLHVKLRPRQSFEGAGCNSGMHVNEMGWSCEEPTGSQSPSSIKEGTVSLVSNSNGHAKQFHAMP